MINYWWDNFGSGMSTKKGEDKEEHTLRVLAAYDNYLQCYPYKKYKPFSLNWWFTISMYVDDLLETASFYESPKSELIELKNFIKKRIHAKTKDCI